jgi:hypothetical protein
LNNIAVEEFIRRVIQTRKQTNSGDPNVELAKLVDKIWAEREDFVKHQGFFSRVHGTRRPFPMSGTSGTWFLLLRSLAFVPV